MKSKSLILIIFGLQAFFGCNAFLNDTKDSKNEIVEASPDSQKLNPFDSSFVEPRNLEYSSTNFLLNTGLNVIQPNVESFYLELQMFKLRISQTCKINTPSVDSLKNDWKKLISSYHLMESQSFGPLYEKNPTTQLDFKSQLYSWPYSNHCLADRFVYYNRFSPQSQIQLPYNSKSLDTIEYLLFNDPNQVKCNLKAHSYLSQWLSLTESEKKADRCQLALKLIQDLEPVSQKLHQHWDRNQFNYTKTLIDGSHFQNTKMALNSAFHALYALETIKDQRLGLPLGKNKECGKSYCPEKIEHIFSDLGLYAIQSRLSGFKQLFFGGDINGINHHGFDDMLIKAGHSSIVDKMKNHILKAENNLQNIIDQQDSFKSHFENFDIENCNTSTIENRLVPLCSFYEDIRQITTTLKSEVLIAVSLDAPPVYQGDND